MSDQKIISRSEAKAAGLKRYFTGKPCKYGHISERTVYGHCLECSRVAGRVRYKADPEMMKARVKASIKKNPERSRATSKAYHAENREDITRRQRARYHENPVSMREKSRSYIKSNPGKMKFLWERWRKNNPKKAKEYSDERRNRKNLATPIWADRSVTAAIYKEVRRLTKTTGTQYHTDHIVPFASDIVCGLHWHENMIPVLSSLNMTKGNRYKVFSWQAAYPGDMSYLTAQYDQAVEKLSAAEHAYFFNDETGA